MIGPKTCRHGRFMCPRRQRRHDFNEDLRSKPLNRPVSKKPAFKNKINTSRLLVCDGYPGRLQFHAKGQEGASVFAGLFDLLDKVRGHRASPRFEPQSELLRESGEDGRGAVALTGSSGEGG